MAVGLALFCTNEGTSELAPVGTAKPELLLVAGTAAGGVLALLGKIATLSVASDKSLNRLNTVRDTGCRDLGVSPMALISAIIFSSVFTFSSLYT